VLPSRLIVPTAQELRAALKEHGWRMTPQRKLILDAIARSRGHISAEQVYRQVAEDSPDVNLTTVYRTLERLEQLGFVRHKHLHGEPAQYERTDEPPHQHLVCTDCGRHQELDVSVLEPLESELQRRYGFYANLGHTAFVGLCTACHGHRQATTP
jgi:Fur family transcriptional regulator, ferric uptake regulator